MRNLPWSNQAFDRVLSISVLEHVFPEVGGDVLAFGEIRRVLKPNGDLLLTVPCKEQRDVIYMDGPVYERGGGGENFSAREYDMDSFRALIAETGFTADDVWRIEEKGGLFAVDHWEWGGGRSASIWPWLIRKRGKLERIWDGPSMNDLHSATLWSVGSLPHAW